MVAEIEELETMDASEIYSRRLNAKEVIFTKENGKISGRWTNKICWRRSGTENTHLDTETHLHHLKTHFWMPVKR